MNSTPLRYPGGKSVITPFIKEIINYNSLKNVVYVEPYAGGAGAAINLLLNQSVESIVINDINKGIYSFWQSILHENDRFIELLNKIDISIDEWRKQKDIFMNSDSSCFELGFATFYLSRTNRSGILNAGPIGGNTKAKQELANYKIGCRFKKENLINKLNNIVKYKDNIKVYNLDAMSFLKNIDPINSLVYLDPPYYKQGKSLYINFYNHNNHSELAYYLTNHAKFNWILSYDDVPEIRELYDNSNSYRFILTYTAQRIKKGWEFFTHSKNLKLPKNPSIKRSTKPLKLEMI